VHWLTFVVKKLFYGSGISEIPMRSQKTSINRLVQYRNMHFKSFTVLYAMLTVSKSGHNSVAYADLF